MTLHKDATFEEFLAEPEEKPYREYLYGRVSAKAMPKLPHSVVQFEIAHLLRSWMERGAGGVGVTEQRCILTTPSERHSQLPDVAWFASRPEVDEGQNALTPPTLAIEVLSPDDSFNRVRKKIRAYLDAGVRVVWIVDPHDRSVLVCRRSQEPVLKEAGDTLEDADLPGLRLAVDAIFKTLDPWPGDGAGVRRGGG